MTGRIAAGVVFLLLGLIVLATGVVVVAPGEVAVVRRLGRVRSNLWLPGPHLGLPIGLDRVGRMRIDEVRRFEVGLAGTPGPRDEPGAGEFLTGDLNLIRARATVQYRVADPVAFTRHAGAVEPFLTRLAESSLTRALSRRGIDAALRDGRAEIARDVEQELMRAVTRAGLGVSVLGVSLTDARPPTEVAADFAAAQAAQSARDRRRHEATAYEATTKTAAEAEARARLDASHARADRAVVLARARSARFLALVAEAGPSRALTVRRLYLDALRDLWPKVKRKLVLTPDEPVDLSILGLER